TEEIDAVGDRESDEEIRDGRDAEIREDLDQRVDLILLTHRADFEKGEAGMHRRHHHRADQQKENVGAGFESFHGVPSRFCLGAAPSAAARMPNMMPQSSYFVQNGVRDASESILPIF